MLRWRITTDDGYVETVESMFLHLINYLEIDWNVTKYTAWVRSKEHGAVCTKRQQRGQIRARRISKAHSSARQLKPSRVDTKDILHGIWKEISLAECFVNYTRPCLWCLVFVHFAFVFLALLFCFAHSKSAIVQSECSVLRSKLKSQSSQFQVSSRPVLTIGNRVWEFSPPRVQSTLNFFKWM